MRPISLVTKISELLEEYPQLEDALTNLSPAFSKLRNPILRKTIARVTTLKQAAAIANIDPGILITTLRKAAGLPDDIAETLPEEENKPNITEIPEWFSPEKIIIRYDASRALENGEIPMNEILNYSRKLKKGEIFEFTSPFIPYPIIEILKKKGYLVWSEEDKNHPLTSPHYSNRVTPGN